MNQDEELQFFTNTLLSEHLGQAIDQMRKCEDTFYKRMTGYDRHLRNRSAVSSILHAFCALEGQCNYLGYEIFFNSDSSRYIPPKERDFPLRWLVGSWDKIRVLDKLSFLIAHYGKTDVPLQLQNRLRELNNLRNWIAHGVAYKTTMLVEQREDESSYEHTLIDMEDSVDWKAKFPNTRFKPLRNLDIEDARCALTIVLECLMIVAECMDQPIHYTTCEYYPGKHVIYGNSFDISAALSRPWPTSGR